MRSFELNDEASLNVYDRGFAQQMTLVFERDLASSTPYKLAHWQRRPWREKFEEVLLNPVRSQL
jgi:cardiolipin synthase